MSRFAAILFIVAAACGCDVTDDHNVPTKSPATNQNTTERPEAIIESSEIPNVETVVYELPRDKARRLLKFEQLYLRGLANSKLKKWNEAIVAYKRALELYPESTHALDGLIECYEKTQADGKLNETQELREQLPKPTEPYVPQFWDR